MEPPGLRDPTKALEYARMAVDQTAGRMPPYVEVVAFAQDAVGRSDEARQSAIQAVRGYRKLLAILKAVFDPQRYPEPDRLCRELQGQLDRFTWQGPVAR